MSSQALRLAMTAVAGLHAAVEQATGLARRSGAAAVQWVSHREDARNPCAFGLQQWVWSRVGVS